MNLITDKPIKNCPVLRFTDHFLVENCKRKVLQCLKLHGFSNRASQFGKLVKPVASFSVTEV